MSARPIRVEAFDVIPARMIVDLDTQAVGDLTMATLNRALESLSEAMDPHEEWAALRLTIVLEADADAETGDDTDDEQGDHQ